MQQRTEVATRRIEMGSKRGRDITLRSRHKIETCEGRRSTQSRPGKESRNMKSSYKQKGGRSLQIEVATQKPEEEKDNDVGHETVVATSTLEKH